ncbi:carotenoid biosynthesis protein [Salipaludibacillus neizhouensis]|uniref:carotenoid biosynthesis protein n=1 Tax=Salipaludibacillus neizhouensis TaxID=885475 RepID=UPI00217DFD24|nr:carotenoid biosynthesis protein [Salipaludibacillus neizhouensis]
MSLQHLWFLLPRFKAFIYAFYGGIIATLDLIIDPVAYAVKRYWVWNEGGFYYDIPFSNFYGWFILSFILHLLIYGLFHRSGKWENTGSRFWTSRMVAFCC